MILVRCRVSLIAGRALSRIPRYVAGPSRRPRLLLDDAVRDTVVVTRTTVGEAQEPLLATTPSARAFDFVEGPLEPGWRRGRGLAVASPVHVESQPECWSAARLP